LRDRRFWAYFSLSLARFFSRSTMLFFAIAVSVSFRVICAAAPKFL
jgi:hypothetical protein